MTAPLRMSFDVACSAGHARSHPGGDRAPPLLEELGLAEVSHDARNNRMRAI
jgi:hypothetical protein